MTVVNKIKCPHCQTINVLSQEENIPRQSYYPPTVPQYTLHEASDIARGLLDESNSLWAEVKVNFDGIRSCHKKVLCIDKEKNEVFVAKAVANIEGTMEAIKDVYWNEELDWDVTTVSNIKIIEDNWNSRLTLKEHKTTSAATVRNDLVVRSTFDVGQNYIWCYSVSEKTPNIPERTGWRRGHLVLSALRIQKIDENWCEVSYIHCFDFGGWIHVKFVEDEQKRVAQRLARIKKKVEDNSRAPPKPTYTAPVSAPTPVDPPVYATGTAVSKLCPVCRNFGNKMFCENDGTQLELVCGNCHSPVTGSSFCRECGNKLV